MPGALTVYVLLIGFIHLRVLLPPEFEDWTIDVFGFIPKRYDAMSVDLFPGGTGARIWTFVTYSLLHANLTHIVFNVLWLLPFGSALARRFGPLRFFLFMAVTAAAGALAHLLTHEHAVAPMIGASASVSGTMAAAIRFAFVQGSFLSFSRGDADKAAKVPALPLSRALRDRRVLGFLAVWFGVNIIFGAGSLALGTDGDVPDLMQKMSLAAGLFKDARQDARIFPAQEALDRHLARLEEAVATLHFRAFLADLNRGFLQAHYAVGDIQRGRLRAQRLNIGKVGKHQGRVFQFDPAGEAVVVVVEGARDRAFRGELFGHRHAHVPRDFH